MKTALCLIVSFLLITDIVFSQTTNAVEIELLAHLENISKYGNYSGSTDEDQLYRENRLLKQKLIRYGKLPALLRYDFLKLKEKMNITTSKDSRLRIYSWDEETGGTMHDYESVFQYRGKSGKVYTWADQATEDVDIGAFYHQVFQVNSMTGPIYMAVSTFIGSTSLSGQSIRTLKISGEILERDAKFIRTSSGLQNSVSFSYDFFSVVDHPERPIKLFSFDETKKTFRFPVVIEDEKTPQGRVTDKFITYQFDGKHFVKTK